MPDHALVPIGGTALDGPRRLDEALGAAARFAEAEKAESTRRAYASDVALFSAWCEGIGASPLPASVATVAGYLATLAEDDHKASTINRRCAAIADWHRRHGAEPPTTAEPVRAVLRGIRRTIGTRVDQKAPATDKIVRCMCKAIPDGTLIGKRDKALLLFGFATAMRRSEIVALVVADLERLPDGVLVHIHRSKTDQDGHGQSVSVPRAGKLGVLPALEAWLLAAGITAGPLFRAVTKGGQVSAVAMSDRAVADVVKRWATTAGLDPTLFSGHSLRAGFVTTALEKGADTLSVMRQTRHVSVETLKKYDRRAQAFKNHAGSKFL